MNTTIPRSNLLPIFLLTCMVFVNQLQAGALVTKANSALIGDLTIKGSVVKVSIPQGSLGFSKENILWYTTDSEVNTFLKASQKALREEASGIIVRKLLEESIKNEPSTTLEARETLKKMEKNLIQKIETQMALNTYREPLVMEIPNVVIRKLPNVSLSLSLDQTEFQGFINYNTFAVVGGTQYTFPIQQPVFSRTSIDTTVIVPGGESTTITSGGGQSVIKGGY